MSNLCLVEHTAKLMFLIGCSVMFFVLSKELVSNFAQGRLIESWFETTNERLDIPYPTLAICSQIPFKTRSVMLTEEEYLNNSYDIEKIVIKDVLKLNMSLLARDKFDTNQASAIF